MKLSEWLVKRSVQAIRLQSNQAQLIMYIGNEAGDLDSGESFFFVHSLIMLLQEVFLFIE